ncbi:hypothetical protein D3C83_249440 [compost metagenome]
MATTLRRGGREGGNVGRKVRKGERHKLGRQTPYTAITMPMVFPALLEDSCGDGVPVVPLLTNSRPQWTATLSHI